MTTWHVLGAGALGCLWAAGLAGAGHPVELLLKSRDRLALFRHNGTISIRCQGTQASIAVRASVAGTGTSTIDNLLITTKAHQTLTALQAVAARLAPGCRVLLVQNGMGVAEQIAEKYAGIRLFCGVTTDGAWCPAPFSVIHAARGATRVGGFHDTADVGNLLAALPADALRIAPCNDLRDRQWQKLAINCAVNALTALYQCRNGDLLTIKAAKDRLGKLCGEIARVGAAYGYPDWRETLLEDTTAVIRLTADNYSSMCQDIRHGRTTEIDFLNGFLIARAKEAGVACPENDMLYRQVKSLERPNEAST